MTNSGRNVHEGSILEGSDPSEPESLDRERHSMPVARILSRPLAREVARFGVPLALGMGLQTTFNLVDAYIIARLPDDVAGAALGAIGICDQLSALGTIVSYGISVATGAILSRKQGEGDTQGVRRVAWQSLLCVLALGLFFALVAAFGAKTVMVHVVGAKGQVARLGVEYLRVMVGGSISIFLLLHLTTIQRALGSSKTPISLLVFANVVNFVLAVLLVYGPGPAPGPFSWAPPVARALGLPRLELMGAAWATIIARVITLVPAGYFVVRRFGLFGAETRSRPNLATMTSILKLAWPTSAQLVVRIVAMLMVHSMVARAFTTETDQAATTALGIVFRLETMALFVALGWGSAAQSFMGLNLGAKQSRRAKQSGYLAASYDALMMALLAGAYVLWGPQIVGFFDADPAVVSVSVDYLVWVAPTYAALGVGIVLGSAIQGAGATRQTLLLDLCIILGIQLPLSLAVVLADGARPAHLWQVIAATYCASAVIYSLAYRRGRYLATVLR